ncbi:hypothetical protein SEA_BUMBLE_32 [Arthrobacter phage Bumble]|uniref:Uncharacterized protein n=1 Tax=Arthrobacter phage Bumble TaxID=2743904 RepID=A0A7G3VCH3_9CAUD|nr:hypothetical protein SEA_BUMBLE_32 [Arthrobacter phage Bumble]
MSNLHSLPADVAAGDVLLLDDGTAATVSASYALSPEIWVLEIPGQMVQCDPAVKVRVRKALR